MGNTASVNGKSHQDAGDLVLYVSADDPTDDDRAAEREIRAFAPKVRIDRVKAYTEISTPRLMSGRSFYRGLGSIRAFIEQEKIQDRMRRRA